MSADGVQQLEFTLQDARNTLRTLQHERELAERIEEGIRKLRSQMAGGGAVEDLKKGRARRSLACRAPPLAGRSPARRA